VAEVRHRTPSRRARDTAADEWRSAFKRTVERCEWCDKPGNAVHEIPRANLRPGCHQIVGNWPKAKQAALLYLRRPGDYDLAVLNRWLVARVSQDDVDGFITQLTGAK
jgi:hypothetical protein